MLRTQEDLLLLFEHFIINIPVLELQNILEALHVPAETQHKRRLDTHSHQKNKTARMHGHTDQLCTRRTEGVLSRLSGNKSISFIIFASLTGSSCLRNVNDVFTHAFSEPADTENIMLWCTHWFYPAHKTYINALSL